jgi:hypothetical protein
MIPWKRSLSSFACDNSFNSSWSSPCCFSRCLIFVSSVPIPTLLSRDVFVVDVVEGARLGREVVVCDLVGAAAAAAAADDVDALLALRTGARRGGCVVAGAFDWRLAVTGPLGVLTLAGRVLTLGGRAATLEGRVGLGVVAAAGGLGLDALEGDATVDVGLGAILGAGCARMRTMLLSRTKSP